MHEELCGCLHLNPTTQLKQINCAYKRLLCEAIPQAVYSPPPPLSIELYPHPIVQALGQLHLT